MGTSPSRNSPNRVDRRTSIDWGATPLPAGGSPFSLPGGDYPVSALLCLVSIFLSAAQRPVPSRLISEMRWDGTGPTRAQTTCPGIAWSRTPGIMCSVTPGCSRRGVDHRSACRRRKSTRRLLEIVRNYGVSQIAARRFEAKLGNVVKANAKSGQWDLCLGVVSRQRRRDGVQPQRHSSAHGASSRRHHPLR